MVWWLSAALAGPVPMFGRAPAPPPSAVAVPTAPIVPIGPIIPIVPIVPVQPPGEVRSEEAFPALLPKVPAEPVKTRVARPGVPIPIDQIPSAFTPIPAAENRLPVVTVRPVIRIEPPSEP